MSSLMLHRKDKSRWQNKKKSSNDSSFVRDITCRFTFGRSLFTLNSSSPYLRSVQFVCDHFRSRFCYWWKPGRVVLFKRTLPKLSKSAGKVICFFKSFFGQKSPQFLSWGQQSYCSLVSRSNQLSYFLHSIFFFFFFSFSSGLHE